MGTAAAVVGGSVVSGLIGANAAGDAADTASAAQRYAADIGNEQFQQTREDLSPYRDQGASALTRLAGFGESRVNPNEFIPGEQDPFNFELSPGYQFRKSEQDNAINRNAAGLGKFLSGNRLEEIMQRSGNLASQEFGDAFNRNQVVQQGQFQRGLSRFATAQGQESDYLNRLQNLAGIGLGAATRTGQFGAKNASTAANAAVQSAQAQGAAQIAGANAIQGAVGDISMFAGMGGFNQPVRNFTYAGS